MSEPDIEVRIEAKYWWRDKSSSIDDRMGRKMRSAKLNILTAKLEGPIRDLLTELLKDDD